MQGSPPIRVQISVQVRGEPPEFNAALADKVYCAGLKNQRTGIDTWRRHHKELNMTTDVLVVFYVLRGRGVWSSSLVS